MHGAVPINELFSEVVHVSEAEHMQPEIGGQLSDGHISELGSSKRIQRNKDVLIKC